MADYFVASGGSNTAPYDTWAKASTSLATALASATAAGDRIVIQYNAVPSGDAEVATDTTYTFAGNDVALISASNDGGSAFTPTVMGTANWIGNSTANRTVSFQGNLRAYIHGVTIRTAGTTPDDLQLANTDGAHQVWEDCYFWHGNKSSVSRIVLGEHSVNGQSFLHLKNCTFRFASTSQSLKQGKTRTIIEGGSIASAGSIPATLISIGSSSGYTMEFEGVDLSLITGTLVTSSSGNGALDVRFVNCKFGSGVTVMGAQTPANKSSARVYVYDCADGDEHYHFQYHDALGSLTVDTGIYANDGAQYDGTNRCSWKIVTAANCSYFTPFVSPWFDVYHSGTSAVTPSIEILRDGSTTAYQDDEVWGEFSFKGTSGSTQSSFVNDRKALTTSAANQTAGVGTSGWTGEAGSAWSGKLAPASTITPAEIGHIRGRVCVGEPSITVYVDPQTRLA